MKRFLFTILVLFLLPTNLSFGNGGPVAWTGTTPLGAIGLVQQNDATLDEENLTLEILDYNQYAVHAEYAINSSAQRHTVKFGVPIRWTENERMAAYDLPGDPEHTIGNIFDRLGGIEGIGTDIKIGVNGQQVTCTPEVVLPISDGLLPSGFTKEVRAWCLSDIVLKEGHNSIVLDYKTDLDFVDMEFTKSVFTEFGERKLVYWLYPAGFWNGPAKKVKVQIALGPYEGLVKKSIPDSFHIDGNKMTWEGQNVDFKKTAQISIELDPKPLLTNQMAIWNAGDHYVSFKDNVTVNTSSTLPSHGSISYSPSNVLDGNLSTAWCSEKQSSSEPIFIEFESKRATYDAYYPRYCSIEGLMLTDGYMKNQSVYMANNRIRKISVGTCNGSTKKVFDLIINDDYRFALHLIENQMPKGEWEKFITEYRNKHGNDYTHPDYDKYMPKETLDFILDTKCFRIEILEVEKGEDNDTCISEISVVTNCG